MNEKSFPVIDPVATGNNIRCLRRERGLSVRDMQSYFGFEEPRAIYKWQRGETLPSVDNLYALGKLLEVSMDEILIPVISKTNDICEQQAMSCCSNFYMPDHCEYEKKSMRCQPFSIYIVAPQAMIVMEPVVHPNSR